MTLPEFIQAHLLNDPHRLLLSAKQYPNIDLRLAAQQIEAHQHIKEKLPEWYAQTQLLFPSALACRQASSQATACYKQRFLSAGQTLYDCTGGLGVDSYYFAQKAGRVVYMEQNESLCQAARHNFEALAAKNIEILHGPCQALLPARPSADLIYIDPSRRGKQQERLLSLSDYEPDLSILKPLLLQKTTRLLIKISPMADLWESLRLLPETIEIHVVSLNNDCKELLFLLAPPQAQGLPPQEIPIHCINIIHKNQTEHIDTFSFTKARETQAEAPQAQTLQAYLYEPNASLLKAGAFKLPALQFGLEKLHPSTHLYTSNILQRAFCGRVFHIDEVLEFNKATIKNLHVQVPQANIAVRNFPLGAEELRKRLNIKEGGAVYLFGATLTEQQRVLLRCSKI